MNFFTMLSFLFSMQMYAASIFAVLDGNWKLYSITLYSILRGKKASSVEEAGRAAFSWTECVQVYAFVCLLITLTGKSCTMYGLFWKTLQISMKAVTTRR